MRSSCAISTCFYWAEEGSSFCEKHQTGLSKPEEFFDPTHNPSHYHAGRSIDPLGVMKETFTGAEYEGFLKGNALKYIMRYQSKNGVQDLKKAIDYINRIIAYYENKKDA
jgi:hypothetical protein